MQGRNISRYGRRTAALACWVSLAAGIGVLATASGSVTVPQMPLSSKAAAPGLDSTPREIFTHASVAPSSSSARALTDSSSSAGSERTPSTNQTTKPESTEMVISADRRPLKLSIPAIGVGSVIDELGLNADGSLEVPARGPSYDHAGWFTGSPSPGESGPAVLLGHINGRGGAPSVFFRLAELQVGDLITVENGEGSKNVFEVYRVEQYPKDQFPTTTVYGDTAGPEVRLITCAGAWDAEVSHYRDNTVVYAR